MRKQIILACTETGDRTYSSTKNKKNTPERLELRKFSPRLKKYTLHREVK
ncbi:MAG: 50S ribosomal protein L33 [Candidatus Cloacimonetes bacterium]|nr:50S ribosomal protein L33 [Candidatus Cloacimonadota bacterium]